MTAGTSLFVSSEIILNNLRIVKVAAEALAAFINNTN